MPKQQEEEEGTEKRFLYFKFYLLCFVNSVAVLIYLRIINSLGKVVFWNTLSHNIFLLWITHGVVVVVVIHTYTQRVEGLYI